MVNLIGLYLMGHFACFFSCFYFMVFTPHSGYLLDSISVILTIIIFVSYTNSVLLSKISMNFCRFIIVFIKWILFLLFDDLKIGCTYLLYLCWAVDQSNDCFTPMLCLFVVRWSQSVCRAVSLTSNVWKSMKLKFIKDFISPYHDLYHGVELLWNIKLYNALQRI